jgi:hypothetical protein
LDSDRHTHGNNGYGTVRFDNLNNDKTHEKNEYGTVRFENLNNNKTQGKNGYGTVRFDNNKRMLLKAESALRDMTMEAALSEAFDLWLQTPRGMTELKPNLSAESRRLTGLLYEILGTKNEAKITTVSVLLEALSRA